MFFQVIWLIHVQQSNILLIILISYSDNAQNTCAEIKSTDN